MSKDGKGLVWLAVFTAAFLCLMILGASLQTANYYERAAEHCQQYEVVPEEHLDRIPNGCVPEYFKERK